MQWYILVFPVGFRNLSHPTLGPQDAVHSVNTSWYNAMELSPLNWSVV